MGETKFLIESFSKDNYEDNYVLDQLNARALPINTEALLVEQYSHDFRRFQI